VNNNPISPIPCSVAKSNKIHSFFKAWGVDRTWEEGGQHVWKAERKNLGKRQTFIPSF
jgi:hypothetical protein